MMRKIMKKNQIHKKCLNLMKITKLLMKLFMKSKFRAIMKVKLKMINKLKKIKKIILILWQKLGN